MNGILSEYRTLLVTVDTWFNRCIEHSGRHIQCRPGCSQCCRGLFDISLLDAFFLRQGFDQLPAELRQSILVKARTRLLELQQLWPDFAAPYLLNHMPDELWTEMPEGDLTPCLLLGEDGRCLVYAHRPMTCRLHGLPNIDCSGESFSDECCTLNFTDADPLVMDALRWDFRRTFAAELDLFHEFTTSLLGASRNELDTFIPLALLIDFESLPSSLSGTIACHKPVD